MYFCVDLRLYVCECECVLECVSDLMLVFFILVVNSRFNVLNQPNFCFVSRGPHFSRLVSTFPPFFTLFKCLSRLIPDY